MQIIAYGHCPTPKDIQQFFSSENLSLPKNLLLIFLLFSSIFLSLNLSVKQEQD